MATLEVLCLNLHKQGSALMHRIGKVSMGSLTSGSEPSGSLCLFGMGCNGFASDGFRETGKSVVMSLGADHS